MPYNVISIIGVFIVMMMIGGFLNIMLNTTARKHWMGLIFFSMIFSMVFTAMLNAG
ncbi:hypothetical protein [Jeotgalibacillus sp. JSM ZJ347]|uniref:hypothetical protein n=1 Tax=Jeotgalibacillus sp. JSM ZJ347 TaxID=3342117 RepID=UPI0035A8C69F